MKRTCNGKIYNTKTARFLAGVVVPGSRTALSYSDYEYKDTTVNDYVDLRRWPEFGVTYKNDKKMREENANENTFLCMAYAKQRIPQPPAKVVVSPQRLFFYRCLCEPHLRDKQYHYHADNRVYQHDSWYYKPTNNAQWIEPITYFVAECWVEMHFGKQHEVYGSLFGKRGLLLKP